MKKEKFQEKIEWYVQAWKLIDSCLAWFIIWFLNSTPHIWLLKHLHIINNRLSTKKLISNYLHFYFWQPLRQIPLLLSLKQYMQYSSVDGTACYAAHCLRCLEKMPQLTQFSRLNTMPVIDEIIKLKKMRKMFSA